MKCLRRWHKSEPQAFRPTSMAKAVGCARKICRAELEEVPPNAMAGNVVVEMPSVVARVGTVNVPTYGLRRSSRLIVKKYDPPGTK